MTESSPLDVGSLSRRLITQKQAEQAGQEEKKIAEEARQTALAEEDKQFEERLAELFVFLKDVVTRERFVEITEKFTDEQWEQVVGFYKQYRHDDVVADFPQDKLAFALYLEKLSSDAERQKYVEQVYKVFEYFVKEKQTELRTSLFDKRGRQFEDELKKDLRSIATLLGQQQVKTAENFIQEFEKTRKKYLFVPEDSRGIMEQARNLSSEPRLQRDKAKTNMTSYLSDVRKHLRFDGDINNWDDTVVESAKIALQKEIDKEDADIAKLQTQIAQEQQKLQEKRPVLFGKAEFDKKRHQSEVKIADCEQTISFGQQSIPKLKSLLNAIVEEAQRLAPMLERYRQINSIMAGMEEKYDSFVTKKGYEKLWQAPDGLAAAQEAKKDKKE